jgi:hypothetical protein
MAANVTTLQRRLQEWTQGPAHERNYRRGPLQTIDGALAPAGGRAPVAAIQLSIAAWLLGTWQLAAGEARVLDGDGHGWDDACLGAGLLRTALWLRCERPAARRDTRAPDLPVLQTANWACAALALGDPHAEELLATFAALPDASFRAGDAFPLFVRELLRLRAGERATVTPRLDVYADVLQAWTGDEGHFARRLANVLDHHLERTHGAPGQRTEFDEPGFWLYPAEVLAVRAVRADLGLPWPKVEHPLMFTNLATTAPVGVWPADELQRRLDRALRR